MLSLSDGAGIDGYIQLNCWLWWCKRNETKGISESHRLTERERGPPAEFNESIINEPSPQGVTEPWLDGADLLKVDDLRPIRPEEQLHRKSRLDAGE